MLEALATIGIMVGGCLVETLLTFIAMKVNLKVVDREFQRRNS